jgi:hypothetical protein
VTIHNFPKLSEFVGGNAAMAHELRKVGAGVSSIRVRIAYMRLEPKGFCNV